jgi:hypothetical protein
VERDDLEFVLSDDLEIRLISVADCAIDHRATNDDKKTILAGNRP